MSRRMERRARSRRLGVTSSASMERERSTATITSWPRRRTVSTRVPNWGRAMAKARKAKADQQQDRLDPPGPSSPNRSAWPPEPSHRTEPVGLVLRRADNQNPPARAGTRRRARSHSGEANRNMIPFPSG